MGKKKKQKSVRIINPVSSSHTTFKSAKRMIDRNKAAWVDYPRSIQLLPDAVVESLTVMERKRQEGEDLDRSIERYRGVIGPDGKFHVVVWWNGDDHRPDAHHRPGEVVS